MTISFQCPHCGTKLTAPEFAVGKSLACPHCESQVTCPEPVYDAEVVGVGDRGTPQRWPINGRGPTYRRTKAGALSDVRRDDPHHRGEVPLLR